MAVPDIELTDNERSLFERINFRLNFQNDSRDAFVRNGETVAQLISALMERKAIPEHRLKYFFESSYRRGRIKGSRRDLFYANGCSDEGMMQHPGFLEHARYFICGPTLPSSLIKEFHGCVKRCGLVSPGDSVDLAAIARRQVRAFGLVPNEVSDEYFKLALDCGMWVTHALHVADRVKQLR